MMFCKEKSTIKIARRETNFSFAPRSAGACGRIWRPEVVSSRALFCPVPTAWPGAKEPKSPAAQETGSSRAARSGNYLRLGLKTDGNISVSTRSIFYFCPSVSVFVASRFYILNIKVEMRFLRPFSRNPVFTWNWPVFILFFIPFLIYIRYV